MKSVLINSFIVFHFLVILIAPLKPYKYFQPLTKALGFYTVPFYFLHSWALFSPNPSPVNYWSIKTDQSNYYWPRAKDFHNSVSFLRAYYFAMDSTYLNYENVFLPYLCRKHHSQEIIYSRFISSKVPLDTYKNQSVSDFDQYNCRAGELM